MQNVKKAIVALAVLLAFMTTISSVSSQATPEIFVTFPGMSAGITTYEATSVGETFQTNINISNGVNIYSWEIRLRFDPTLLVVSAAQSGGFLSQFGSTFPLQMDNQSDFGYVVLGELFDGPSSASGNGTLVIVTFTVLGGGRCNLGLYDTYLYDPSLTSITHTTQDGTFVLNMLALTPSKGTAAFIIEGFGFTDNTTLEEITWDGEQLTTMPKIIGTDSKGNFVAVAAVPESATPGNYTVLARDLPGESASATFWLLSIQGPEGPQGPAGEKGEQGDIGPAGPEGSGAPMEYSLAALI